MSEYKIEIEALNFPTACDKCGKLIPSDIKALTVDTCPQSVAGELVCICQDCLVVLKIEVTE